MDLRKVLPIIIVGGVALVAIIKLLIPENEGQSFNPPAKCCQEINKSVPVEKVKFYLETSLSMKGYTEGTDLETGNFPIKDLPQLISRIRGEGDTIELYTVSDSPKIYTSTLALYNENLSNGKIFIDHQSRLQNSIISIIDSLKSEELAVFVSDCIVDLGDKGYNRDDLRLVTGAIYDRMVMKRREVGAVVFQYYSDFNGTHYYNLDNNRQRDSRGELTGTRSNSYQNTMMRERPYYLWVFAQPDALVDFVERDLVREYDNSYSYGLSLNCCDMDYLMVPLQLKGSVLLDQENLHSIAFTDFDREGKISFTIGVDLSSLPKYAQSLHYLKQNVGIRPGYMGAKIEQLQSLKEVQSTKEFDAVAMKMERNEIEKLTHFVTLSLTAQNDIDIAREYHFTIEKSRPEWLARTHLEDDRNLSLEEIKGKTFGFESIMSAFDNAFESEQLLVNVPFSIYKKR